MQNDADLTSLTIILPEWKLVLRICDIYGRIWMRIRILGCAPLTNGSGDPYPWFTDLDARPGSQFITDPAETGFYLDIFVAKKNIVNGS
jgi:hypothetical protein